MSGVREIKGRIKSVRNIQQITKAMKMVAAARIKKVETRMKAARPYAYKMKEVVAELVSQLGGEKDPLMEVRTCARVAVVVVGADKGLCGSYNNNLLRLASSTVLRHQADGHEVDVIAIGNKAWRFFQKRGYNIVREVTGWSPDFTLAADLAALTTRLFVSGKVDEVWAVYTHVESAMSQVARVDRILPLGGETEKPGAVPYLFEPDAHQALAAILPRYLETIFFQILLESRTAELGARLRAMSNATDNAEKLVGTLTLDFFRARQAAITNEILEVASGAEALNK